MGMITFVVEYEDGKEPPVHANMDVLGGKLVRVAWSDAIQDMDDIELDHQAELERVGGDDDSCN
ncbi:hypothetical protein [Enterobacter asburiae]|uniref:hypothetical protein n=1 Tax=Enterobacter asburiae TaxID=61645 RepID=UPI0020041A4B|nr:hypothetical protein [Enterobacter asburiae]MCK6988587.1 hypothetical protein [Enterobacter asburiae]